MDSSWNPSRLLNALPKMPPLVAIPPPITASVFLPTRSSPQVAPPRAKPWYHRKAAALETDLQLLLNVQASRLADPNREAPSPSESGLSTPSASSAAYPPSHAQKRHRPIPLRSARTGLYTTMRRLAALKDAELSALSTTAEMTASHHEQLLAWTGQRTALRARADEVAGGRDTERAKELRGQAEGLQPEITELEDRLAQLRNEQRRLRREAEEVAGRVEGRVAGCTRRIETLEKEVAEFLHGLAREADEVLFDQHGTDERGDDDEGFWAAPKRRTLEMAVDVIGRERERVEGRCEVVETEREALLEGAVVWGDVVRLVERFEKELRQDLRMESGGGEGDGLKDMLGRMDEVIDQLESQIRLAESKGWKLLIAAIGAELDTFVKGRDVLQDALDALEDPQDQMMFDGTDDDEQAVNSVIRSPPTTRKDERDVNNERIEQLDHAFERAPPANGSHDTDEDDDGPDPELMISHHDTDTD